MITNLGQQALISILSHLMFIGISWWALQAIHFDKLLRANKVMQARILYVFLSIALGSIVSNFFLDYIGWSNQLPTLLN